MLLRTHLNGRKQWLEDTPENNGTEEERQAFEAFETKIAIELNERGIRPNTIEYYKYIERFFTFEPYKKSEVSRLRNTVENIPNAIVEEAKVLETQIEEYIYEELNRPDCYRLDLTEDNIYLVFIPKYRGYFKLRGVKFETIKKFIKEVIKKRERLEEAKQTDSCYICNESIKMITDCFDVVLERGLIDRATFENKGESDFYFCKVCENSCCLKCELKISVENNRMICPYCRDSKQTRFKFKV